MCVNFFYILHLCESISSSISRVCLHAKTNYRHEHYYCATVYVSVLRVCVCSPGSAGTCWFNRARNIFGRFHGHAFIARAIPLYGPHTNTHTHFTFDIPGAHCMCVISVIALFQCVTFICVARFGGTESTAPAERARETPHAARFPRDWRVHGDSHQYPGRDNHRNWTRVTGTNRETCSTALCV